MKEESQDPDAAFVALLTEHQNALRFYVASLLPGDPSAADVSQQANSTIWRKRSDFEPGTNFKAWIFSIARYEVLNHRKTQARDARLIFTEELEQVFAEEMLNESDDLEDRRVALKSCLEKLKTSERDLIMSRYFRDTSLREHAEEIGRSVNGLKVSLHRVRNKLLSCIEHRIKTGPLQS